MATYAEIDTLSKDAAFVGKLEVAVIKYTEYILSEDPATAYHAVRMRWANTVVQSGAAPVVSKIALAVAFDSVMQANLASYTDAQLQSAAEVRINRIM